MILYPCEVLFGKHLGKTSWCYFWKSSLQPRSILPAKSKSGAVYSSQLTVNTCLDKKYLVHTGRCKACWDDSCFISLILFLSSVISSTVAVPAQYRSQVISRSESPPARSPGCTFFLKKSRRPFLVVSLKTPAANAFKIKQIKRSNVITFLCSVHTITEAKQYAGQSQCLSQGGGSSRQVIWPGVPCCSTATDLVAADGAWNSLWASARTSESYSVCIIIIVIQLCGDYFEVLFDWQEVCCVEFHPVHQILASGSRDFSVKFYEYSKPSVKKAYKSIQVLEYWSRQRNCILERWRSAARSRDWFAEKKYSSKSRIVGNAVFFLNTMIISTLRWAVLTVFWIGFCHTGPISLCVD